MPLWSPNNQIPRHATSKPCTPRDGASPDLKVGDGVEITITGIGCLRNRFVAKR
jgi:hypothetical protein